MIDYHMHCRYSEDSNGDPVKMIREAELRGIDELCFTDHVECDAARGLVPPDLAARNREFADIRRQFPKMRIKLGAELSLGALENMEKSLECIEASKPDFIIASLHLVEGLQVWEQEYFIGRAQDMAYSQYLEGILDTLPRCRSYNVLGHYDFCAKYAPYEKRDMHLENGREAFDAIMRLLVREGKGMEINTASWQEAPAWGLDVLRRFVELGGEYVTFGSDAHSEARVGRRIDEAYALAAAAGVPYYATFDAMQPKLHKLN